MYTVYLVGFPTVCDVWNRIVNRDPIHEHVRTVREIVFNTHHTHMCFRTVLALPSAACNVSCAVYWTGVAVVGRTADMVRLVAIGRGCNCVFIPTMHAYDDHGNRGSNGQQRP